MNKEILYSVITPVYNREDSIMRCLESVEHAMANLNGQGGNVEHIVVDDGSSDHTAQLVEDYARCHERVRFFQFGSNRGTNAARNKAISEARGKWCIFLDSDDYFVDEALQTISDTMQSQPEYRHYMFAPDDMQPYYQSNAILQGAQQKVVLYPDFLNGYVGGDFIHVCNTEILRRHLFDEKLRIHEGVFFLMFFREARQMLFTNKVVTIRERNRADSVTRESFRTSLAVINRTIIANELRLREFEADYVRLGMARQLRNLRLSLLDNYLLAGRYKDANGMIRLLGAARTSKYRVLKIICAFRMGWLYRHMLMLLLFVKYKVMKKRID